jgi:restriction endonuclease S subunit
LTTKKQKIEDLEALVKNKIQEINDDEECEEYTFDELCTTVKGKQLSKEKFIEGKYPVIGGGITPTGYHNNYNMNKNTILCSSSGANAGHISKYDIEVWASDCFSIVSKNKIVSNNYLYYALKNKQDDIFKCQTGSAQPHVYASDLAKHIKFLIPKNKKLFQNLEPIFGEIESLQYEVKTADKLYNQYIKELSEEAIPANLKVDKQGIETIEEDDNLTISSTSSIKKTVANKNIIVEESEETEILETKPKKKSIKKTN